MGVDTILRIVLWLVLLAFFWPSLTTIIYFIGLFFGAIASMFNLFSYIGASCDLINSFEASFIIIWLWFVFLAFYKSFFSWK